MNPFLDDILATWLRYSWRDIVYIYILFIVFCLLPGVRWNSWLVGLASAVFLLYIIPRRLNQLYRFLLLTGMAIANAEEAAAARARRLGRPEEPARQRTAPRVVEEAMRAD